MDPSQQQAMHSIRASALSDDRPKTSPVFSTGETDNIKPQWQSLFAFASRKHAIPLVFAVIFALASGAIPSVQAITLGSIFQSLTDFGAGTLSEENLRDNIRHSCFQLVGLGWATWALKGGFFMAWVAWGELQVHDCRLLIFDGLSKKLCSWFDRQNLGNGALVARLHTHMRELQIASSQPLGAVVECSFTAMVSLIIAIYYCWSLTLVILATVPILAFCLAKISADFHAITDKQQHELANASKLARNALLAIETVKAFNGQDAEQRKYQAAIAAAAKWYATLAGKNALQIGLVKFGTLCMFVQGFWYGHRLVMSGNNTIGDVVTTFWSTLAATQAIEQILPQLLLLGRGRAAGSVLRTVISPDGAVSDEQRSDQQPPNPDIIRGDIELRNVTFSYPTRTQKPALNDVSCTIPSGLITFIIGKSGCGKSTLSQLLLRLYDPMTGVICLDGCPISSLGRSWLRRNISLVEQECVLFRGTLEYNIGLGSSDSSAASLDEVNDAIEFALLQDTIGKFPSGLETVVENQGGVLSGGQRQRVALARARLRDSPILILDESTSALDPITRLLIMAAIRSWRRGKTTIIISHDISQIATEDFVLVLEDGTLVKSGARAELKLDQEHPSGPTTAKSPFIPGVDLSGKSSSRSLCITPSIEKGDLETARTSISCSKFQTNQPGRLRYVPSVLTGHISPTATTFWTPRFVPFPRDETQQASSMHLFRDKANSFSPHGLQNKVSTNGSIELIQASGAAALRNRASLISCPGQGGSPNHQSSPKQSFEQRLDERSKDLQGQIKCHSIRAILLTVWPSLDTRGRILLLLGALSSVLHAIATPIFAWLFSKLLATFHQPADSSVAALQSSVAILCIAVIDGSACFYMHSSLESCGQAWVDHIRVNALIRFLAQPKAFFVDSTFNLSQLITDLDRSAEEMRNLLGRFAAFILVGLIMMSAAVFWSLVICWKLTVVGLSAAPASYAITRGYLATSARMENKCNDAADLVAQIDDEVFTNIKTTRALALEKRFELRHAVSVSSALSTGLRRAIYCGLFFGLSEAFAIFMTALIFWYGATLISKGESKINDVMVVLSMLLFSLSNVSAIVEFIPQIQSSKDTAARLLNAMQLPRTSDEHSGSNIITGIGDICLHGLSFSYTKNLEEAVLRDVELVCASGRSTAIVGPSGSGKSTIVGLLLRFYAVQTTELGKTPAITISGRDINDIETLSLRSLMAVVPQRGFLFPASITENIKYGLSEESPHSSDEAVRAAARNAGIDDFIVSLPLGYNTLIGDGGTGLSGGQVQRISLARALVRDPQILILDEATSALDAQTAAQLRETMRRLLKNRPDMTVIMVTHDREMMEIADHIAMLEHGRIVQQGKFYELISKAGPFAAMLAGGNHVNGTEAA